MRRRDFITALAVCPFAALAQPAERTARIGVLLFSNPGTDPNLQSFRRGLRELGYVEGRNIILQFRSAEGQLQRLPRLATELVELNPALIFALGGDVFAATKNETRTVPVVFSVSTDPVAAELVSNLARPGENATGVTFVASELAAKRLQFLKEAMPSLSRVGVLWNPDHPDGEIAETRAAGRTLGISVQSLEVRSPADFDRAFRDATNARAEAVIVVSSRLMTLNRQRIIDFAGKHRLPLASGWGPWANGGGLLSYGPDLDLVVARAALYVDKILKGAKPGDLPVEQPTRFELIVNLKTARALGLTIPQSLLLRADQVIE
jgi:putative ABC transport system substrate-binding protein